MVGKCQAFRGGVRVFKSVRLFAEASDCSKGSGFSQRRRTIGKCRAFGRGVGWLESVRLFHSGVERLESVGLLPEINLLEGAVPALLAIEASTTKKFCILAIKTSPQLCHHHAACVDVVARKVWTWWHARSGRGGR
jgi:hypothetical protein